MTDHPRADISIGGHVEGSILITGSHNIVILERSAARARIQQRDPTRMLRVAALLAAPVHDPTAADRPPAPLDLRGEWRRELAADHPDAFLPDLARSLGAHGMALQGLGRHAEAADAFGEGVRILTPFYRELPQAYAGLMEFLGNAYRDAYRAAGREPEL